MTIVCGVTTFSGDAQPVSGFSSSSQNEPQFASYCCGFCTRSAPAENELRLGAVDGAGDAAGAAAAGADDAVVLVAAVSGAGVSFFEQARAAAMQMRTIRRRIAETHCPRSRSISRENARNSGENNGSGIACEPSRCRVAAAAEEDQMKRFAVLLLILVAVPLLADDRPARESERNAQPALIADVIRMTNAGVSEDAILAFVRKSDERVDVTADDLIALTDAHVSKSVITAIIDVADDHDGGRPRTRERVVVRPRSASSPYYWGWNDPFYYDPFWYGPRVSIGFGFGGYRYGGYRHYGGGFHQGLCRHR